jgi:hypothetical protein
METPEQQPDGDAREGDDEHEDDTGTDEQADG